MLIFPLVARSTRSNSKSYVKYVMVVISSVPLSRICNTLSVDNDFLRSFNSNTLNNNISYCKTSAICKLKLIKHPT